VTSSVFGVQLDELDSKGQLVRELGRMLEGETPHRVFTPNPEILLLARRDHTYASVLNTADLALPDGTGVALVESIRARRHVRRWPGVEIASELLQLAATRDVGVVLLGGRLEAAERAADRWRSALPGLRVDAVGSDVAFGPDGRAASPGREEELIERIETLAPSVVLVGLGAPKQERWIADHAELLPSVRVLMGVGGAFDMWGGTLRRAPEWLRAFGLEWLWRLALEPARLPRIARATLVFPVLALVDRS
jgi:N-acetylglucosaminyldiphosphoundecaprenol N-acetyl-beta-D-mannosaminyltransferase